MESKDLITLVIPCYKAKDYLKTSIPSVLRQSYGDFELILIDDHSQDEHTLDLLHDFARQDPRIKLFFNESNLAVSKTRNKGVELAKGKYLTFLEQDDELRPDFLAQAYEALEKTKLNFAWFHVESHASPGSGFPCVPDGVYIPQNYVDLAQKVADDIYVLEREPLIFHPQFLFTQAQPLGKFVNLQAYKQANIYFKECFSAEDQEWFIHLCLAFPAYALVTKVSGDYMLNVGSLSHLADERVCSGRLDVMQARYELLEQYNLKERLFWPHLLYCVTLYHFTLPRFEPKLRQKFRKGFFELLCKQGYSGDMILQALNTLQQGKCSH